MLQQPEKGLEPASVIITCRVLSQAGALVVQPVPQASVHGWHSHNFGREQKSGRVHLRENLADFAPVRCYLQRCRTPKLGKARQSRPVDTSRLFPHLNFLNDSSSTACDGAADSEYCSVFKNNPVIKSRPSESDRASTKAIYKLPEKEFDECCLTGKSE
eukprot:IDg7780t1